MSGEDYRYVEETDESSGDDPDSDDASGAFVPYGGVPYGAGWGWSVGWLPVYREDDEETFRAGNDVESDDSLVNEAAVSVLLLVGTALFLFPEPATSALGVVLLAVAVLAWWAGSLS